MGWGEELKNRLGEPWNVLISIVVLLKTHMLSNRGRDKMTHREGEKKLSKLYVHA